MSPERRVCVMLLVFGDESYDEKQERVFAVAGVVGGEEQWAWLDDRWQICCDGIPFHAKDCDANQGDFERFTPRENQERYKALTIMLAESGLGGYGIILDLAAQRRIFPDALLGLAYYKCFIELVQKMRNCAEYYKEIAEFTFDMRPEGEYNTGLLYGIAQATKNWNPFLSSKIGFECSKNTPRLQAADLFAREMMKAWDNRIGPIKRPMRKSWKCLKDTGRFHGELFGEEWFFGLKEHMPELEERTGMSMSDYAHWLRKTKRLIDNNSNRFDYIKYAIQRDGE